MSAAGPSPTTDRPLAGARAKSANGKPSRGTKRLLACMFVAAVTLVSPLESGLLPTRLGPLLEPSTALAQTTTRVAGTAQDCSTIALHTSYSAIGRTWIVDPSSESECVLELPACPASILNPGKLMRLSVPSKDSTDTFQPLADPLPSITRANPYGGFHKDDPDNGRKLRIYPEFCEERISIANDVASPPKCRDAKGFVVEIFNDGTEDWCRLLRPMECPDGLHRIGLQKCRAVKRRGWDCQTGYEHANQFNQCYQIQQPDQAKEHPACGTGAPKFPLGPSEDFKRKNSSAQGTPSQQACAEYVDDDYTPDLDCASDFPTGTPVTGMTNTPRVTLGDKADGGANNHWCQYDAKMLQVECHSSRTNPSGCSLAVTAFCLKRASLTGGCATVAAAIRCRAHQAAFAGSDITAEQVRDASCEPCHTLPFDEPAPNCPSYSSGRRSLGNNIDRSRIILEYKDNIALSDSRCSSLLKADIRRSAINVNNSTACKKVPVCTNPPSGRVDWSSSHGSGLAVVNSAVLVNITDIPLLSRVHPEVGYNSNTSASQTVFPSNPRYQYYPDAAEDSYDSGGFDFDARVRLLTKPDDSTAYPNVGSYNGLVQDECTLRDLPKFNIIIEELWPNTKPHADEIKDLFGTDALRWWEGDDPDDASDDLSATEKEARTRARGALYTEEIECADNYFRTCAWTPTRSGYFKVVGVGAWISSRSEARSWLNSGNYFDALNALLSNSTGQQELRQILNNQGLTGNDIGLKNDLTERLEVSTLNRLCIPLNGSLIDCDADWLHSTEATTVTGCGAVDLRVSCGGGSMGNYTKTEPIGIIVHEVRVNTVMSNN